ncbi:centrosome-associated protein CEP250-like [Heptranchias perlo]|uniref:centrosome-associated protein CEP250-like n=1 Tax=Heptranchias perlo TaxID=212740 RepID=UPI003559EE27
MSLPTLPESCSHVLAELDSLDPLLSALRLDSNRLKCTCLSVSRKWLALGSSAGGLHLIQKEGWKQRLMLTHKEGALTHVTCCQHDEDYVAVATSQGHVIVWELHQERRGKPERIYVSSEHKGRQVTALCWDTTALRVFVGDNLGKVSGLKVNSSKQGKAAAFVMFPVQVITTVDSRVVQLDYLEGRLLVSSLTRCYLCDTDREKFWKIGNKERDGEFGACFLPGAKNVGSLQPLIFCARPGSRMWEVNFEGEVLSTHQFKQLLASPPLPIITYRSELHYNMIACSPQSISFPRLLCLSENYVLSWTDRGIYVFIPQSVQVLLWSELKDVQNVAVYKNELFCLHGDGRLTHLCLLSGERCAERLLRRDMWTLAAQVCCLYQHSVTASRTRKLLPVDRLEHLKTQLDAATHSHLVARLEEVVLKLEPFDSACSSRRSSFSSHESFNVLDSGIYRVISRRGSQSDEDSGSLHSHLSEEERLREFASAQEEEQGEQDNVSHSSLNIEGDRSETLIPFHLPLSFRSTSPRVSLQAMKESVSSFVRKTKETIGTLHPNSDLRFKPEIKDGEPQCEIAVTPAACSQGLEPELSTDGKSQEDDKLQELRLATAEAVLKLQDPLVLFETPLLKEALRCWLPHLEKTFHFKVKIQTVTVTGTSEEGSLGLLDREEEQTGALLDREEQTGALLDREEQTGALLDREEQTGALLDREEEQTGALLDREEEQTGALLDREEEQTGALLDREEEQTGALLDREEQQTGALLDREEQTGALLDREEEQTGVLLDREEQQTGALLDREEEQTGALLDREEQTGALLDREEEQTGALLDREEEQTGALLDREEEQTGALLDREEEQTGALLDREEEQTGALLDREEEQTGALLDREEEQTGALLDREEEQTGALLDREEEQTGALLDREEQQTGALLDREEQQTGALLDREEQQTGALLDREEQQTGALLDREEQTGALLDREEEQTGALLDREEQTGALLDREEEQQTGALLDREEEQTGALLDREEEQTGALLDREEEQTGALLDREEEQTGALLDREEEQTGALLDREEEQTGALLDREEQTGALLDREEEQTGALLDREEEQTGALLDREEQQTGALLDREEEQTGALLDREEQQTGALLDREEEQTGALLDREEQQTGALLDREEQQTGALLDREEQTGALLDREEQQTGALLDREEEQTGALLDREEEQTGALLDREEQQTGALLDREEEGLATFGHQEGEEEPEVEEGSTPLCHREEQEQEQPTSLPSHQDQEVDSDSIGLQEQKEGSALFDLQEQEEGQALSHGEEMVEEGATLKALLVDDEPVSAEMSNVPFVTFPVCSIPADLFKDMMQLTTLCFELGIFESVTEDISTATELPADSTATQACLYLRNYFFLLDLMRVKCCITAHYQASPLVWQTFILGLQEITQSDRITSVIKDGDLRKVLKLLGDQKQSASSCLLAHAARAFSDRCDDRGHSSEDLPASEGGPSHHSESSTSADTEPQGAIL